MAAGWFVHVTNMEFRFFPVWNFRFCLWDDPDFFFSLNVTIETWASRCFHFVVENAISFQLRVRCLDHQVEMKRGNTVDNCNFLSSRGFCAIWIAILFSFLLTKQQRHVTDRKMFARVFSPCMKLQFCCAFVIALNEIKIYGFGAFLILRLLALFRSFIPRKYSFDWLWIIKDFLCWWLAQQFLSCLHTCER